MRISDWSSDVCSSDLFDLNRCSDTLCRCRIERRVQIGLARVVISVIAVKILLCGKIWRGIETHSVERLPNCDAAKIKVRVDGECRCRVTAVAIARIIASYRQRQGDRKSTRLNSSH